MDEDIAAHYTETQVSPSGRHLVSEKRKSSSRLSSLMCCSEEGKKLTYGLILVFSIALSWVGAQQFSQSAVLSDNFSAPYFTVWFSTCWMVLCFPAYSVLLAFTETRGRYWTTLNDAKRIFSDRPLPVWQLLCKVFGFTFLWVATNYCYVYSLSYIASTDASAIISSNVAIVYIMSLLLLKERFYILRILATALSVAGVVLFAYADGYGSDTNLIGVLLALLSAFGSAGYKVLFKRAIWQGSLGQVCLFLSILGILNAVIMWIVFIILYFTGVESFAAADIPWDYLCGSSTLSLLFNFLVNFGVAYTYPLFISIAMMLGIPINALVDFLVRGILFSPTRLIAALLIIMSFVFTMCPDSFNYPIHRLFGCFRIPRCDVKEPHQDDTDDDDEKTTTATDYTAGTHQEEKCEMQQGAGEKMQHRF